MHAYAREAINQKAVVMARRSDLTPRLRRRASASMFISLETRHLVWGSNIFNSKYLSEELKGEVYKALVLPTILYGCEAWSLREDLYKRLRSFHNRCARSMCRVNLYHTFRHHITTSSLFRR